MGTERDFQRFFTAEQRRELSETLGLLPEQIDEVESTLPSIRAFLKKAPARNDVLAKLQDLATALRSAHDSIASLLAPNSMEGEISVKQSALAWVHAASFDVGEPADALDMSLPSLRSALSVVDQAVKDVSGLGATRNRTASTRPVALVDGALLRGFLKAHGHLPGRSAELAGSPRLIPSYVLAPSAILAPPAKERSLTPSAAEGSDYRRIVEMSYEAAGSRRGSREKAIKAFINQQKKKQLGARERHHKYDSSGQPLSEEAGGVDLVHRWPRRVE